MPADTPLRAAHELAADTAAALADPYGIELIGALLQPGLAPDDALRLSLLAREVEALGMRASRARRAAGDPDIDHDALASVLGGVADYLRGAKPRPTVSADPHTPGPINPP